MRNIISPQQADGHHIRAYNFRVLTKDVLQAAKDGKLPDPDELTSAPPPPPPPPPPQASVVETPPPPPAAAVVDEKLLNKLDELSDSVVKLQMQLEKQEAEFAARLSAECEQVRANALAEGKASARSEHEQELARLNSTLSASCNKLNAAAASFDEFKKSASDQLKETAILIAKEVINKELSAASAAIAESYARTMIAQLDASAKARLSVNPADYEHVKAALASDRISVSADEAVGVGALVIHSDSLNARIDLKERFAQARALLEQS